MRLARPDFSRAAYVRLLSLAMAVAATLGGAASGPLDFPAAAARKGNSAVPATPKAAARFDVAVDNAGARAFFLGLASGNGVNIVLHPDVRGTVSLALNDVTVEDVLGTMRDAYGFDYRRTSSGYLILPATIQTRVFHVNYLNVQRGGTSLTRVSSGQVSQSGPDAASSGATGSTSPATGDGEETESGGSSSEVTGTRIATQSDTDFWVSLERSLKSLLASDKSASVVVNAMAGIVVVRGMPDRLREVEDYLAKVQDIVTRQVVIEAKIVEVALDDAFQSGVNWSAVITRANGNVFGFGQTAPRGGFAGDPLNRSGRTVNVTPGANNSGVTTEAQQGAFAMSLGFGDFNAFIELLETQGRTRVLSSPRVATLHNQKAVIKAGSDEFFVTDVSSETVSGTATSTSRDVQLTPFFSGIALDVTPQIGDDGHVTLHIHPAASEVRDQSKTLTVSGTTDTLPLAISEIRESDSIVRAASGQVIVIGGLMRTIVQDSRFGTPGLSSLPLVGNLFRSKQKLNRKSELVILLRPTIIQDDEDWAPQRAAAQANIESIDTPRGK
jgi:MSHA biogenesis protein MshL